MKQTKIYLLVAVLFIGIALVGCAGSRGGYNCPATKGMSGYR